MTDLFEIISLKTQQLKIVEEKVRRSTKHHGSSPTIFQFEELAKIAEKTEDIAIVFKCLWVRLNRKKKKHRSILRSLELIEYMMINSKDTLISQIEVFRPKIKKLTSFKLVRHKKDKGKNVREKAAHILKLIQNPTILRQKRDEAKLGRTELETVKRNDKEIRKRKKKKKFYKSKRRSTNSSFDDPDQIKNVLESKNFKVDNKSFKKDQNNKTSKLQTREILQNEYDAFDPRLEKQKILNSKN
ncbi:epsin/ent-related [Anaeramoeba flamelloides]|uniref:Epsin/ent-related n=1 Tax=Anaeramoeba flamelloides TaxID=1746091 RepID=A0AAV7ZTE6_9EUKA|nr:epsin/ent-related [Anaeramoeba flamelloides]KAJ6226710.1 epsin/ent-related [Anaeramoeba flamelloides]